MKKRTLSAIIVTGLSLGLSACNNSGEDSVDCWRCASACSSRASAFGRPMEHDL